MKQAFKTMLLCLGSALLVSCNSVKKDYSHWDLGVGIYGSPAGISDSWTGRTMLDVARMDWMTVNFGNEPANKATVMRLNEFLRINPKIKFIVRLWPGFEHQEKGDAKPHKVTFFDYNFNPEIRARIRANIKQQIRVVLDNISNPDAVYGFTFQEELPFHFSDMGCDSTNPDILPRDMIRYKEQYEKETHKELIKWDANARRWWAAQFRDALNDIHIYIKSVGNNKKVFLWMAAHYRFNEWLKDGEDINQFRVIPIAWHDLIKPGCSDGFFAYNNNPFWMEKYRELAQKNSWPFFTQLSQPSSMRLSSWEECIRIAKLDIPENLGYFLYIEGNDRQNAWNDDPSIPENDNLLRTSSVSHLRRFCAQHKINLDIVDRELTPILLLHHELGKCAMGHFTPVFAVIQNCRDSSWYLNKEDAVLRNLKMRLILPDEFELPESNSPPAEVGISKLDGEQYVTVLWWARRIATSKNPASIPVSLRVSGDNFRTTILNSENPIHPVVHKGSFSIQRSGEIFRFIDYSIPWSVRDTEVTLFCKQFVCSRPSIEVNGKKLLWNGELRKGDSLVLGPGVKGTLYRGESQKGIDVSSELHGMPLSLKRGVNEFTYRDENIRTGGCKVEINVKPLE